jgi:hypothetical protein
MRDCGLDQVEGRVHAEIDHPVPQLRTGIREIGKNHQPGIVDQCIEAPEPVNRELHNAAARRLLLQVLVACGRRPAIGHDLLRHAVRHRRIKAGAILRDTGIVHHDARATRCQQPRVGGSKTPARAGDDRNLAVKSDRVHPSLLDARCYDASASKAAATAPGAVNIG